MPARLDWVLHFAARTAISQSQIDPQGFLRDNLAATQAALDVSISRRASLLYLSSYVYGQPLYNPVDELHPLATVNPYMASKLAGEELCARVCQQHGLNLLILRPFSVFGDRRQPGRLVSDLIDGLHAGQPLQLNDPTPRRDHLYAPDFSLLILAILGQASAAGVYNVGAGIDYSNLEVATMLAEIAGDAYPIAVRDVPRPQDVSVCVADLRKVSTDFQWQPRWPLRQALAELVQGLPPPGQSRR